MTVKHVADASGGAVDRAVRMFAARTDARFGTVGKRDIHDT